MSIFRKPNFQGKISLSMAAVLLLILILDYTQPNIELLKIKEVKCFFSLLIVSLCILSFKDYNILRKQKSE